MKKIFLLLFFASGMLHAQDPGFSQPQNARQLVNPALTGTNGCAQADASYRLQWPKLPGTYKTANLAYEHRFRFGGIGFNFMQDNAADLLFTTRADLSFSGYIPCFKDSSGKSRLVIQPGLQIGYLKNRVDLSALTFGDMIGQQYSFIHTTSADQFSTDTRTNLDFAAGLLLYSKRICSGIAVFHLTEPNTGLAGNSRLPMRFVWHISGLIGGKPAYVCEGFRLVPSFLFMNQQDVHRLRLMINAAYNNLGIGIGYRVRDAVIFQASYSMNMFRLSYSWDLTTSKLGKTGGAHEIHFTTYLFRKKRWEKQIDLSPFTL